MTARPQTPDRDEVLFAFHEACPRPTAQQIIDWTSRYPQFADDIRAHAAVARDWDARRELPADEPSETELARAYSRAINALYEADAKAAASPAPPQTFQDILAARGTNARALAQEVGIGRGVIADLIGGRMRGPVGRRFLDAVCRALAITHAAFSGAIETALGRPQPVLAKAAGTPTVNARSYEEVIRDSGMTEDQIRYWLDED
jgi:DNA-binding Xre family transcriptional regulator